MSPLLQQGISVFVGTLPLIGVIGWAALSQNARFDALGVRMSRIEAQLDRQGSDISGIRTELSNLNSRVSVLEDRGGRLVR